MNYTPQIALCSYCNITIICHLDRINPNGGLLAPQKGESFDTPGV